VVLGFQNDFSCMWFVTDFRILFFGVVGFWCLIDGGGGLVLRLGGGGVGILLWFLVEEYIVVVGLSGFNGLVRDIVIGVMWCCCLCDL